MLAKNLESELYITLDIVIVYGNETSNETYFKICFPRDIMISLLCEANK